LNLPIYLNLLSTFLGEPHREAQKVREGVGELQRRAVPLLRCSRVGQNEQRTSRKCSEGCATAREERAAGRWRHQDWWCVAVCDWWRRWRRKCESSRDQSWPRKVGKLWRNYNRNCENADNLGSTNGGFDAILTLFRAI
jgi:hypothetical protein